LTLFIGVPIMTVMKTQDAISYFGTQAAMARALHCSQSSIAEWGEYPPDGRQFQIQVVTNGALMAEPKKQRLNHQDSQAA
jgi:transcriptional repressor of cell division inhibition gene dicB